MRLGQKLHVFYFEGDLAELLCSSSCFSNWFRFSVMVMTILTAHRRGPGPKHQADSGPEPHGTTQRNGRRRTAEPGRLVDLRRYVGPLA